MPRYYTYLISSLPMPHFGTRPPFSFTTFLEKCQDLIPEKDIGLLKMTVERDPQISRIWQPTLKRWFEFERALRNELARLRGLRRKCDSLKYIRPFEYTAPYFTHIATLALRNPVLIEAEKMLDQERWLFLDELERGHYFDLDFLIIYALKLLILERWEKINTADKAGLLEEMLRLHHF